MLQQNLLDPRHTKLYISEELKTHCSIPYRYTLEYNNSSTTFDGTENDELVFPDTDNSDRKCAFSHSNTLYLQGAVLTEPQAFCYCRFWSLGRKQSQCFHPVTSEIVHFSSSPSYPTSPFCPVFPYTDQSCQKIVLCVVNKTPAI